MIETISPAFYTAPALLYIICIFSAMSFVLSTWEWLYENEARTKKFTYFIWNKQFETLVFIMFSSLCVGLYDFIQTGNGVNLYGEVTILILWVIFSLWNSKKKDLSPNLIPVFGKILGYGLLTLCAVVATIMAGYIAFFIMVLTGLFTIIDSQIIAILTACGSWCIPVILLYGRILHSDTPFNEHLRKGFHHYLWPILFAYIALLCPLMMQDIANSEKWHDMKNTKPIRRA